MVPGGTAWPWCRRAWAKCCSGGYFALQLAARAPGRVTRTGVGRREITFGEVVWPECQHELTLGDLRICLRVENLISPL